MEENFIFLKLGENAQGLGFKRKCFIYVGCSVRTDYLLQYLKVQFFEIIDPNKE